MLSQYVIILGQEYWKTAKITPPIIIKLLLGHLSILIIEKELLGNCWRCSSSKICVEFPKEICIGFEVCMMK